MNTKQLFAAAAILAATGSTFAQQTEFVAADANFTSTKTRAEVMAEVNQAYADGTLIARDGQEPVVLASAKAAPGKTRAEVVAELNQAYADGTLIPRDGADNVMVATSHRSRDEVRAEAATANQGNFKKPGA
jgi:hypothetical protein